MTDTLWHDDASGLVLKEGDDGSLIIALDAPVAILSNEIARRLADALNGATGAQPNSDTDYFQVFYVHEYNDEGDVIPITTLGPDDGDNRFTWDEADLNAVKSRLKNIGEALNKLHRTRQVDHDNARAWISIYAMPHDECVWKGYWDDFDGNIEAD